MKIRIIRSKKRRKTIQAREVDGTLEVLAPANMSDKELEPHIVRLKGRIERHNQKFELDDEILEKRAHDLSNKYFEGLLQWNSIRWVTNQSKRHGSCTTGRETIRISHRIANMPRFVKDYVIVHELAHLVEPNHGNRFWELVNRYPKTERARGYLMAVGLEDIEE
ncbi:MAG: M48 family metallopeptidase [Deltaproteobacteria bacterium]|nr:M48 family metallopeptidase [Deltaproteobacteria bacterium]